MTETTEDRLREALLIAIEVLEIAEDWGAPRQYDIPVPESWNDTKGPDSKEPDWPTLNGVIRKCKEAING